MMNHTVRYNYDSSVEETAAKLGDYLQDENS